MKRTVPSRSTSTRALAACDTYHDNEKYFSIKSNLQPQRQYLHIERQTLGRAANLGQQCNDCIIEALSIVSHQTAEMAQRVGHSEAGHLVVVAIGHQLRL